MDGEIEDKGIQERKKIYLFLCLTISRISVVLLCCGERCKSVFLSFFLSLSIFFLSEIKTHVNDFSRSRSRLEFEI